MTRFYRIYIVLQTVCVGVLSTDVASVEHCVSSSLVDILSSGLAESIAGLSLPERVVTRSAGPSTRYSCRRMQIIRSNWMQPVPSRVECGQAHLSHTIFLIEQLKEKYCNLLYVKYGDTCRVSISSLHSEYVSLMLLPKIIPRYPPIFAKASSRETFM